MAQGMLTNDPARLALEAQNEHEAQLAAVVAVIRPLFNDVVIRTIESAQGARPPSQSLVANAASFQPGETKSKQMEVAGQPISLALDLNAFPKNIPPASVPSLLKEAVDQLNAGVQTLKVNFSESGGQFVIGASPSQLATAGAQADVKVSLTAAQLNQSPLLNLTAYADEMRKDLKAGKTKDDAMEAATHHVYDLVSQSNLSDSEASAYAKAALDALQEVADGKRLPADARLAARQEGAEVVIKGAKKTRFKAQSSQSPQASGHLLINPASLEKLRLALHKAETAENAAQNDLYGSGQYNGQQDYANTANWINQILHSTSSAFWRDVITNQGRISLPTGNPASAQLLADQLKGIDGVHVDVGQSQLVIHLTAKASQYFGNYQPNPLLTAVTVDQPPAAAPSAARKGVSNAQLAQENSQKEKALDQFYSKFKMELAIKSIESSSSEAARAGYDQMSGNA
ncbi:MAG: hypothetical protein KGH63_03445, partial [Candidatus Micrarchaeota archaeon]|nr:hypothetical protein [Candidatus Micrarchaeota archaeon]